MKDLLIDLDNTVYPEDSKIFSQIDFRMKSFISLHLNLSFDEAYDLQKKYFLKHGTTLRGLMMYHNINPNEFLKYVHDIDLGCIKENQDLKKRLQNYKGKKIIFTNGTLEHAQNVLKRMRLDKYIDFIFDIVDAAFIPKPNIITYEKVISKYDLDIKRTVMIDDIPNNLKTAKKLGIKTSLISKNKDAYQKYDYIDIVTNNLLDTLIKIDNGEI